jgi:hypothetical protein
MTLPGTHQALDERRDDALPSNCGPATATTPGAVARRGRAVTQDDRLPSPWISQSLTRVRPHLAGRRRSDGRRNSGANQYAIAPQAGGATHCLYRDDPRECAGYCRVRTRGIARAGLDALRRFPRSLRVDPPASRHQSKLGTTKSLCLRLYDPERFTHLCLDGIHADLQGLRDFLVRQPLLAVQEKDFAHTGWH